MTNDQISCWQETFYFIMWYLSILKNTHLVGRNVHLRISDIALSCFGCKQVRMYRRNIRKGYIVVLTKGVQVYLVIAQCDASTSVIFEVTAVMTMSTVFWDLAPCSTVNTSVLEEHSYSILPEYGTSSKFL